MQRDIEINTTGNVAIRYELAPFMSRLFAFILDALILWGGILILWLFILPFFSSKDAGRIYLIVMFPTMILYSLVSEYVGNGSSLGKKALGIRVMKVNGKQVKLIDYMLRWVFRPIDIYFSSGVIASILINSTERSQRIGDILADTVVVKMRPSKQVSLHDILKIHTSENYTPKYPEVVRMSEEDILTVKQVLDASVRYQTPAHYEVLDLTVKRLAECMGITDVPINKLAFLRTLINDYVVLTR